jgi:zinc transporter 1/2/3
MGECNLSEVMGYNFSLHVGSVFLMIGVSSIGAFIPVLAKTKHFEIDKYVFLVAKCFGIGIITATAFVHMLIPAVLNLTNPCLSTFFTDTYPALSGAIALISVLTIQFIQTVAVLHFSKPHAIRSHDPARHHCNEVSEHLNQNGLCEDMESIGSSSKLEIKDAGKPDNVIDLGALNIAHNIHSDNCCPIEHAFAHAEHNHSPVTTYILEFGISIHSILIGLALGVASGNEFIALLIALCFHQFFEGFALSSTALDAGFKTLTKPILMAIFYSLTTPIGMVIGIGIRNSFNPNDPTTLILQGSLDSIAAGILMYDSIANLITTNITHNVYFASLTNGRRAIVFASLWLSAFLMSFIGLWA